MLQKIIYKQAIYDMDNDRVGSERLKETLGESSITFSLGSFITSAETACTRESQWADGTFTFCPAMNATYVERKPSLRHTPEDGKHQNNKKITK